MKCLYIRLLYLRLIWYNSAMSEGIPVADVIEAAKKALYTGHIGDGKIFVYPVEKVVKIRTGEEDFDALQDVE